MTSYVENEAKESLPFEPKEILDLVAQKVLEEENCPYEAQINLLLTDNEGIREFNRQYREVDAPTDVLSFPMIPFEREADKLGVAPSSSTTAQLVLGDAIGLTLSELKGFTRDDFHKYHPGGAVGKMVEEHK